MKSQSQHTGLYINKGDELITYIVIPADGNTRSAMKYVLNLSSQWYCAGSANKIYGESLEVPYDQFMEHRDIYLNEPHMKMCKSDIYEMSDDLLYKIGSKIKSLKLYLDALKTLNEDLSNDRVIEEAKNILALYQTPGHMLNDDIVSENKKTRMAAKSEVKKLRLFIAEFE